ncbi:MULTISPECIES: hypothetical protein [unclassified Lentilitoribacter]|uniref:hypothetical protein n=1 Tax=unclassified Lentilitoribacter TaxID=2647570 RepID=UPI0013A6BE46|nr:hypothetical protein [Lentilitoribacter sp. Alg239-R112]
MSQPAQPYKVRISNVLGRLEALLDLENSKIGKDLEFDIAASSTQKSRCLYEITTLLQNCKSDDIRAEHQNQLNAVQEKLAVNKRKLETHMEAVRDIANMLKDAVHSAEDDGTYSMGQFGGYELS